MSTRPYSLAQPDASTRSKRGRRVASWPTHHPLSAAASPAVRGAYDSMRATPSDGVAYTMCRSKALTASATSAVGSPLPHHGTDAARAAGAPANAAVHTPSTASAASRRTNALTLMTVVDAPGGEQISLRQLLAHDLAHDRAVGSAGDLRHHVGHHAAEVGHARRPYLGDRVVHDLLDLVLGEWLGHELLEDRELALLGRGLLLAAAGTEGLGRLDAPLALALKHLQLLVLGKRPLQLLLRALERVEDQAERIAALGVPLLHRLLQLRLDGVDPAHAILPVDPPPSTCQCRWKIVCPAPGPTLTTTR